MNCWEGCMSQYVAIPSTGYTQCELVTVPTSSLLWHLLSFSFCKWEREAQIIGELCLVHPSSRWWIQVLAQNRNPYSKRETPRGLQLTLWSNILQKNFLQWWKCSTSELSTMGATSPYIHLYVSIALKYTFWYFFHGGRGTQRLQWLGPSKGIMWPWRIGHLKETNWILRKKRDKLGDKGKVFCYCTSSAKAVHLCIHSALIYWGPTPWRHSRAENRMDKDLALVGVGV